MNILSLDELKTVAPDVFTAVEGALDAPLPCQHHSDEGRFVRITSGHMLRVGDTFTHDGLTYVDYGAAFWVVEWQDFGELLLDRVPEVVWRPTCPNITAAQRRAAAAYAASYDPFDNGDGTSWYHLDFDPNSGAVVRMPGRWR